MYADISDVTAEDVSTCCALRTGNSSSVLLTASLGSSPAEIDDNDVTHAVRHRRSHGTPGRPDGETKHHQNTLMSHTGGTSAQR